MLLNKVTAVGLGALLVFGLWLAWQQGQIALRDQSTKWSDDYSFTLQGACLPDGQLAVEVPAALHTATTRRLMVMGWHLTIGRFYSITGQATANGQNFDFAESDHRTDQRVSAAHVTSRILRGGGHTFSQDYRFNGNQKFAINQATCS